jgi:hypothetical protein
MIPKYGDVFNRMLNVSPKYSFIDDLRDSKNIFLSFLGVSHASIRSELSWQLHLKELERVQLNGRPQAIPRVLNCQTFTETFNVSLPSSSWLSPLDRPGRLITDREKIVTQK